MSLSLSLSIQLVRVPTISYRLSLVRLVHGLLSAGDGVGFGWGRGGVSPALKLYMGSGKKQLLELHKHAAARTLNSDVVNILIQSRFSRKRSTSPTSATGWGGEGPPGRRP